MRKLLYREATPEDWPAIVQLHLHQQAMQGTNYELPRIIRNQMIPLALVGVDDEGAVRQCLYVEAVAELRFVGCDARATALSRREATGVAYVLKLKGFRWIECVVPRKLKKHIEKPLRLAGFESKDSEL
ncbi:MAG: hypothetical protein KGL39_35670, partial [Patescibacteria group bacterium]|nr:hypothetical protein [Patescibacteria group bacterium]